MSVDYSANFGIGYKVCESDYLLESEELEDGLLEYLEGELGDEFECFETENAWSGDRDGVFVKIIDPFINGVNLTLVKEQLDCEMKRLKLDTCGSFGAVGGLNVY